MTLKNKIFKGNYNKIVKKINENEKSNLQI